MKKVKMMTTLLLLSLVFYGCDFISGLFGGEEPETPVVTEEEETPVVDTLTASFSPDSDTDGDGILNKDDSDIDGDGLANTQELIYHTSPYIVDTDGDGWDDNEEVGLFSASKNIFNPAIADIPQIQLILLSEPAISMEFDTSSGTSEERSSAQSTTFELSTTASESFSSSASSELGWSVEVGVEASYGLEAGVKASVTAGLNGSYTNETSHEWGSEESATNSTTAEEVNTLATEQSLNQTGGEINYSVKFKNTGNIGYTVNSMELTAYRIDHDVDGMISMIGAISQETASTNFQPFTLAPGVSSGVYSYENGGLFVSDVIDLLQNSSGIICSIAGYTISMGDSDFTQSATGIAAKTAKIYIDYGPGSGQPTEQYSIATKTNVNLNATSLYDLYNPVSLKDAMDDVINIVYTVEDDLANGKNGLTSVRGFLGTETNKRWYVVHTYTDNNQEKMITYAASECDYDFDSIEIRTGDTVELIYSVDGDGDGLPLRVEELLGTSDTTVDSDGDTLSDFDEVSDGTDPSRVDTDRDGINDNVDEFPTVAETSDVCTLSNIEVNGTLNFDTDLRAYTVTDINSDSITITPTATNEASFITMKLNDDDPIVVVSGTEITSNQLNLGENTIILEVKASDGVSTETYTITVDSQLATIEDVNLNSSDLNSTTCNNTLSWTNPVDSRIDGVLIRYATCPLDDASPRLSGSYSVGESLGNGKIISNSGLITEFKHEGRLQDVDGYYEIFMYNQDESTFTWSEGVRDQLVYDKIIGGKCQGGIIAHFFAPWETGYVEGETHGIIAATADISANKDIQWITGGSTQTTEIGMDMYSGFAGAGQANTTAMLNQLGMTGGAAKECDDYVNDDEGIGVYSDWYLPSQGDLQAIVQLKDTIGGFKSEENYWTSTEMGDLQAVMVLFTDGGVTGMTLKSDQRYVRAVRSF